MKIQIKDLKPNPYRDIENYPIIQDKVQSLINSINQTGFWDNILARKNNGNIEIAYGHHRLIALQAVYKPDDFVDIPIRELDDPTMIRIMANENDESWGTSPKIIDETVRVTKKFLENNPNIAKEYWGSTRPMQGVPPAIISRFLNGNWSESRISYSLERIKGEETEDTHEQHIDKEAVEMYPTERSARGFVKAIKQIKNITPEKQRIVAQKMIDNQNFGESAVKSELLHEKYKDKTTKKDKEEHDFIEFKDFISECTKDMKRLNEKLEQLFILKIKLKFDFELYHDSTEAKDFDCETRILIDCLKKLLGKEGQNAKDKLLQISD